LNIGVQTLEDTKTIATSNVFFEGNEIVKFLKHKKWAKLDCSGISNPQSHIGIKDHIFAPTGADDSVCKIIKNLNASELSITFERCIFTEELRFEHCDLRGLYFKNCQFVDNDWHGRKPSGVQSLSLNDVHCNTLEITYCVFINPMSAHDSISNRMILRSSIIPTSWLQSMRSSRSTLDISLFSGGKIHLPDGENSFTQISIDDTSLPFIGSGQRVLVTTTKR
jgi:hypothetical protein